MYAGRLSMGTEDDIALREKYAWELLNMTNEQEYDSTQRKFILEFAGRIFWLDDPGMNREVKEAYKMKTIPLDEYSRQIRREEALMDGETKGKFEVARSMLADGLSSETIRKYTGLDEQDILSLG
jgi:predicted transposase/invertase (TIGR01784 family)